jgi:hypothetical protein
VGTAIAPTVKIAPRRAGVVLTAPVPERHVKYVALVRGSKKVLLHRVEKEGGSRRGGGGGGCHQTQARAYSQWNLQAG